MSSKVFSSLLASVGWPTIKVEGQPPRIWEISSDWSSYRNGINSSIEQALVGREEPDIKNACKGG